MIHRVRMDWRISCQPKTNLSGGVADVFGDDGGDIVRVWVFVIVNRPFGRNCSLLGQTADKSLGVMTESIVRELTEPIRLAVGVVRPRVGRKQHGGAQAVRIGPLDCLNNKLLVAEAASSGQ